MSAGTDADGPPDMDASGDTIYGFKPLPHQDGFIHSQADEVLLSGAFGAGKTRGLNEKVYLNSTIYPGNRTLLTRKTYSSITNTTLKSLMEEVIPQSQIVGGNQQEHYIEVQSPFYPTIYCAACGWTGEYLTPTSKRDKVRRNESFRCPECGATPKFTPASEIYYEGLSSGGTRPGEMPEKIAGMNLGGVALDEAIEVSEKDWEMLQGRLRLEDLNNPFVPELPSRQIYSATNPADPNHWLYKRFYERGVGEVYEGSTADNIHNPDDYLERLENQYTGADAERLIGGEWRGYEGLVYDDFSDSLHVLDPLDALDVLPGEWTIPESVLRDIRDTERERSTQIGDPEVPGQYQPAHIYPPEDAPILMAIDWGYRPDPLVVQWWARTDTHGYVLYREHMKTQVLPDDAAAECFDQMERYEIENVQAVIADHDTGDRADWLTGCKEYIEDEYGSGSGAPSWRRLKTTKAAKDINDGIKTVTRRLRPDKHDRAGMYFIRGARFHDIDRRLRSDDRPGSTLAEMRGYAWESDDSDQPQDNDNHGMDAMRYMAHTTKSKTFSAATTVNKS